MRSAQHTSKSWLVQWITLNNPLFSVLQVFPDSLSLQPLVSGERHLHALQDHRDPAQPQSLQQHGGLHRSNLHRRPQSVLQHPQQQAHEPPWGPELNRSHLNSLTYTYTCNVNSCGMWTKASHTFCVSFCLYRKEPFVYFVFIFLGLHVQNTSVIYVIWPKKKLRSTSFLSYKHYLHPLLPKSSTNWGFQASEICSNWTTMWSPELIFADKSSLAVRFYLI